MLIALQLFSVVLQGINVSFASETKPGGCAMPQTPYNGNFEVKGCEGILKDPFFGPCWKNPETQYPVGQEVTYYCNPGWILQGAKSIRCLSIGTWSEPFPRCCKRKLGVTITRPENDNKRAASLSVFEKAEERRFEESDEEQFSCPPLLRTNNVEFECQTPDGRINSCDQPPLPPYTVAHLRCPKYYRSTSETAYRYRKCKPDGTWSTEGTITCVPDCGRSDAPKRALITYGITTQRGKWPWHAALYTRGKTGKLEYICGGSLISKSVVLTAAHCVTLPFTGEVRETEDVKVVLGKYWRQYDRIEDGEQRMEVQRIIVHPSYSGTTFDSDMAIIILKSSAEFNFYVGPVCFPEYVNSLLEEYHIQAGNIGTVLGWGVTEKGVLADKLKEAHLPVVSAKDCIDAYNQFFQSLARYTNFCAGYVNGTGVCHGDSGSGMVFPAGQGQDQRWYLQGIVSVGAPDPNDSTKCNAHLYTMFTRVGRYSDWLVRTLTPDGYL